MTLKITRIQKEAGATSIVTAKSDGTLLDQSGNVIAGGGGGAGATNLTAIPSPTGVVVASDTGTDAQLPLATGTNAGLMEPAQVTKLAGIAAGATVNATDAQLRDRTTHTGTQPISTITGLQTALDGKATLISGKLDPSQVPDIALQQYLGVAANQSAMLALSGQLGDWCTRSDTGTDWRIVGNPTTLAGWLQTSYPSAPVASVAGRTGAVTLTKADVGLGNVDNTSDANKPVSTPQALALESKLNKATKGLVGATPIVVILADAGLGSSPHTLTVTPASGCTILVESSYNGATWEVIGTITTQAQWDYDLSPSDPGWVTHVRMTRTAGTATTSTFSIRG